MSLTTYGDISPRTAAYAAAGMLKRAQPYMVIQQFGQMKPIPANSTDTVKFRRYEALTAATTPLVEGVTPSSSNITKTDVTSVLQQYGAWVELTDKIADTHEDPVLDEYKTILGEQAALTVETVIFNLVKAGTNVVYANGTARSSVNTAYDLTQQRLATRTLKRQNARFITRKLSSTPSFNTENVAPSYIGLCHVDVETTIRGLTGFKDVVDYGAVTPYEFEIGSVENVRYIQSTVFEPWADAGGTYNGSGTDMITTTGSDADVYPILILASDAFGITPLKGKNAITPMVLNPNQPSPGDPLGQRGSIAWKTYIAACILNQNFMIRNEVAVPELS